MKLIDCFIFYNELDLLNYRLNILNDVVDYFVIVESRHTFIGNEKPLFFKDNAAQFEQFSHKIIHVVVDDFPFKQPNIDVSKDQQWLNEYFQRNCIKRGIDQLELNDNDYIIVCDLDEIPDKTMLTSIINHDESINILSLELDMYYYSLNSRHKIKWYLAKILSYKCFKQFESCEKIRQYHSLRAIRAGWHLSCFGDAQFIKNKLENFSHQEYNNDKYTEIKSIENKINAGVDLLGRDWVEIDNISIKDNLYLPTDYEKYLSKYYTY